MIVLINDVGSAHKINECSDSYSIDNYAHLLIEPINTYSFYSFFLSKKTATLKMSIAVLFFQSVQSLVDDSLVKNDVSDKTYDDKNECTKSVCVIITKVRKWFDAKWITKHTCNHHNCAHHNCDKS